MTRERCQRSVAPQSANHLDHERLRKDRRALRQQKSNNAHYQEQPQKHLRTGSHHLYQPVSDRLYNKKNTHMYDDQSRYQAYQETFDFRKRQDRVDWRMLAGIDVTRIIRELDLETLQSIIENITFADIETEGYHDRNFIKLFQLSQLIIEYLLHCQTRLLSENEELKIKAEDAECQYEAEKDDHEKTIKERDDFKKEIKSLKKTVYAFQMASKVPGGMGQNALVKSAVYWRCRVCPKVFATEAFLIGHEQRRHPEIVRDEQGTITPKASRESTDLKRLGELLETFAKTSRNHEVITKEDHMMDIMKELEKKKADMEKEYQQYRLKYEQELQQMRVDLSRQVQEERNALEEERQALHKLMESSGKGIHTFGTLEDDDNESVRSTKKTPTPILPPTSDDLKRVLQDEIAQLRISLTKAHATDKRRLEEQLSVALREVHNMKKRLETPSEAIRRNNTNVVFAPESKIQESIEIVELGNVSEGPMSVANKTTATKSTEWELILQKLHKHTKVNIENKPWITSYLPHLPEDIDQASKEVVKSLSTKMDSLLESHSMYVLHWQSNPELAKTKLVKAQHQAQTDRDIVAASTPFFVEMRQYLQDQLQDTIKTYKKEMQICRGSNNKATTMSVQARPTSILKKSPVKLILPPRIPSKTSKIVQNGAHERRASNASSIPESIVTVATSFAGSPDSTFHGQSAVSSVANSPSTHSALSSPRKLTFSGVASTKLTFQNALRKVSGNITKRLFFRSSNKSQGSQEPKDIDADLPPLPTHGKQDDVEVEDEDESYTDDYSRTSESPTRSIVSGDEYSRSPSPALQEEKADKNSYFTPEKVGLPMDVQELQAESFNPSTSDQGWASQSRTIKLASIPSLQEASTQPVQVEEEGSFSVSDLSHESISNQNRQDRNEHIRRQSESHDSNESSEIDFGEFALSEEDRGAKINSAPGYQRTFVQENENRHNNVEEEDLTDILDDLDASTESLTQYANGQNTDTQKQSRVDDTPIMDDIEDFDFDD